MLLKLVQSETEAIDGIKRFHVEAKRSVALQARTPYARAWYVVPGPDGVPIFGPSKFVGYVGMTAEQYVAPDNDLDGRKTESRLQDWFRQAAGEKGAELALALRAYLATFGTEPSKLARINILRSVSAVDAAGKDGAAATVDLVAALLTRFLTPEQLGELRERI